jgi:putative ABC transport system permease protein
MAMSARERVTEVAVLRAIGFPKGTILGLLLAESGLIALLGASAGLLLYVGLFGRLRTFVMLSPMANVAAALRVYPNVLALAFSLTVAVGLVAGLVPALRLVRLPIVNGLRLVA